MTRLAGELNEFVGYIKRKRERKRREAEEELQRQKALRAKQRKERDHRYIDAATKDMKSRAERIAAIRPKLFVPGVTAETIRQLAQQRREMTAKNIQRERIRNIIARKYSKEAQGKKWERGIYK